MARRNSTRIRGKTGGVHADSSRRAFTMIELLVVITIMLLLVTFTAIGIDAVFTAERVGTGARQVQSLLEGARDRAIYSGEPQGVRLLLDPDTSNGRMASSMVYIGAADTWNAGHITLKRPDFDGDGVVDNVDFDGDGNAPETEIFMVEGDPGTLWNNLKKRGYLGLYEDRNFNNQLDAGEDENGNGVLDLQAPRIKIPGDRNGTWYNVLTYHLGRDPSRPNLFQLVTEYRDPGTTPDDEVIAFEGTGPSTYILELPPRILPDAEPVALPDGVVIDLDASQVPDGWRPRRPPTGFSGDAYLLPYSNRMDILFSPRGTVTGASAAEGLVHLYLGLRDDVLGATVDLASPRPPVYSGGSPLVPADKLFTDRPLGDRSLVTVVTSTGKVASHALNVENSSPDDGYLDDPFLFAETGEVLSQ